MSSLLCLVSLSGCGTNSQASEKEVVSGNDLSEKKWHQVAKLYSPDAQKEGQFGCAVAISGAYALVGAYLEDADSKDAGAAYIFKRTNNTWVQQAKLQANDREEGDEFGYSVAVSGDYAIVGAAGKELSVGTAYIFKRKGNVWEQQAKIQANDKEDFDFFGHSVAISGDYAVVGAHKEGSGGDNTGAVYIFKREGDIWIQQTKIQAYDKEAKDEFGWEVSVSGNYVVVGAHLEDTGGKNAGAAYIFKREGNSWIQQAKIQSETIVDSDQFGSSVAIFNDCIVVGAPMVNIAGYDNFRAGAAYVFRGKERNWVQETMLKSNNKVGRMNEFGSSVAVWNNHIIAGIATDMSRGNTGAVYIFQQEKEAWPPSTEITANDKKANDFFGSSVAVGQQHAVVGVETESTKASNAGAVYIFQKK